MLNVEELTNDLIKNKYEYIFNFMNRNNRYSNIQELAKNSKNFLISKNKKYIKNERENIKNVLLFINKAIDENHKILVPFEEYFNYASQIVFLDENTSVKEAKKINIPNIEYMEIRKDNYHIFEKKLIDFLKTSLSFNTDIAFCYKDVMGNKLLKNYISKQMYYKLNKVNIIKNVDTIYDIKKESENIVSLKYKDISKQVKEKYRDEIRIKDDILRDEIKIDNKNERFFELYKEELEEHYLYITSTVWREFIGDHILKILTITEDDIKNMSSMDYINLLLDDYTKWNNIIVYKMSKIIIEEIKEKKYTDIKDLIEYTKKLEIYLISISSDKDNKIKSEQEPQIEFLINNYKEKLSKLTNENIGTLINCLVNQKILFQNIKGNILKLSNVNDFITNGISYVKNEFRFKEDVINLLFDNKLYFLKRYVDDIFVEKINIKFDNHNRGEDWVFKTEFENIDEKIILDKLMNFFEYTSKIAKTHDHDSIVKIFKEYWEKEIRSLNLKNNIKGKNVIVSKRLKI